MNRHLKVGSVLALVLSTIGVTVASTTPTGAASVTPSIVLSNIECSSLSPAAPHGYKVTPGAIPGTYALPSSGGGTASIAPNDNKTFNWSSTYPLDAVIVFGGAAANVYRYNNVTSDTSLSSPLKNGKLPDISHVWFCHDGVTPVTVSAGATSVAAARGVATSDIPISVLAIDDPVALAQAYEQLAGAAVLKQIAVLKQVALLKQIAVLKAVAVLKQVAVLKAVALLKQVAVLKQIDGSPFLTPLSSLNLNVLDSAGNVVTWERVLAGTTYEGWPLQSVTFADVAELLGTATDTTGDGIVDYPGGLGLIANASLFDLDSSGALVSQISLLSILLLSTPLASLSTAAGRTIDWCGLSAPYTGGDCLVDDANGNLRPDATLFELALYGVPSSIVPVNEISMAQLRPALASSPLGSLLSGDLDGNGTAETAVRCTTANTLGQCLAEIITPAEFPWEDMPIASMDLQRFALGERLPVTVRFSVGATVPTARITLPTGFVYDAGAGATLCQMGTCSAIAPVSVSTTDPQVLTFGPAGLPAGLVELRLTAAPKGLLDGAPGQPARNAGPVRLRLTAGAAVQDAASSAVTVTDPWVADTEPTVVPDTLYFGSLAGGAVDDYDVLLAPAQQGSWVSVRLKALSGDLDGDLALYAAAPPAAVGSAALLKAVPVPGASAEPLADPSSDGETDLAPETLQDVPTTPTDPGFPLLRGVSANRGDTDEVQTLSEGSPTASTRYRIKVSAFGTSAGDYTVRVIAAPSGYASCPATTFAGSVGTPVPVGGVASPSGLIVYNTRTTSGTLLGSNTALTGNTLFNLARANGSWLLPVTPADSDLWTTANPTTKYDCAPVAANATVQAISDAIRAQKAGPLPGISSIVLVGGDDALPFYRNADTTTLANESSHADQVGTDNPISASQGNRFFMTDDPYGTLEPIPWLDRTFSVPDLAVGRLVETDTEIQGQIGLYLANDGALTASTALVTGYDFLSDGAATTVSALADGGLRTSELIDPVGTGAWTAQSVRDALALDPDVAAINAHFSQYELLSSKGDSTGEYDVLDVAPGGTGIDLPTGILEGSVLFSAGCHAGMSVPDAYATNTTKYPLLRGATAGIPYDWAQALSQRRSAVWVASFGYGYGAVDDVALTERLMGLYAKYLVDPTVANAGQALVKAKQEYFATQGVYGSYDEKALQEVVFYGIPTFRLGTTSPASPSLQLAATSTGDAAPAPLAPVPGTNGMPTAASLGNLTFDLTARPSADGTAYTVNGETLAVNGYPVMPKTSVDVTVPGLSARGAAIERMTTTLLDGVLPQIARATVDNSLLEPSRRPSTVVFPTAFQSIGGTNATQRLVVVPGQFSDLDDAPGQHRGQQLLLNSGDFTVYYADASTAGDLTRPYIQESTASIGASNVVLFRVKTTDLRGPQDTIDPTGVRRVLVQYDASTATDLGQPNPWIPVELQMDSTGTWVGALVTGNTAGRYLVQAFDGAGNQAISQFKGAYYVAGGVSPQAVAVVTEGTLADTGWYRTDPVGVSLFVDGRPAVGDDGYSYVLGNSAPQAYAGTFDPGEGPVDVRFIAPAGKPTPPPLTVQKDTRAPSAALTDPVSLALIGEPIAPSDCFATDPDPGSTVPGCTPLDPTVVTVGSVTYSLTNANATDLAGNRSTTVSQTAVIVDAVRDENGAIVGANGVTVIAGGQLYDQTTITVDGVVLTGVLDAPNRTYSVSFNDLGSHTVVVTVPGSDPYTFTVSVDDATAPTLTPPGDLPEFFEATSPAGAPVTFTVSVTDNYDSGLVATCTPASGSVLPIGTSTVDCSATDSSGNTGTTQFNVLVKDTTAPTLGVPADITQELAVAAGNVVTFTTTATDAVDASVTTSCSPASGSVFPKGTTTVQCSATDASGNAATGSFTVTVRDTTVPVFTSIPNIGPVEARRQGGDFVGYSTPDTTDAGGPVSVSCSPASDSFFPLGTTTVGCTAIDAEGLTATASFTVTVRDTTAPTLIGVPTGITAPGTTTAGAKVSWTAPTATDAVWAGAGITVACLPASGSTFAYGNTTVTCTATDGSGNRSSQQFVVTVAVAYRYNGFFSPVNMSTASKPGVYDGSGLTYVVNSVNGGRNVPFKWEAYDNITSNRLVSVSNVEIIVESYAAFAARPEWTNRKLGPSRATLPTGNPCADTATRVIIPVSGATTGKTTSLKFDNNQFNIGVQMPAKPARAADNCFVAWTRITGPVKDPLPGIVTLFVLT